MDDAAIHNVGDNPAAGAIIDHNHGNEVEINRDAADDDNANNDADANADADADGNNNGVIDGGGADGSGHKRAAESTMLIYIECEEEMTPSIPAGATISIGLEKSTKLSAVFKRFCNFANSYKCSSSNSNGNHLHRLEPNHFEFVHCSILNPSDTVESAALMKEDRIKVQRNKEKERKENAERAKEIRDSDRIYFQDMRTLLPDLNPSPLKSDVIFHCNGKMTDEQGYKQGVLSTLVRGHSAMIVKRCAWLAGHIEEARTSHDSSQLHNHDNRNIFHFYDSANNNNNNNENINNINNNNAVPIPESDNAYPAWRVGDKNSINISETENRANAVEDDDYEHDNHAYNNSGSTSAIVPDNNESIRPSSPVISFVGTNTCNTLQVTLMHPPQAVRLLLEYCYTNRVVPLGFDAFMTSYRPIEACKIEKELQGHTGPVEPFNRLKWPNDGMPTISLSVALAGIQLAEEANLPRLSLMCEIAASKMVSSASLLEALALCEEQHRKSGNKLQYLRKAVMLHHILGHGSRGVDGLSSMPSFRRILRDRSDVVVPSLMMGVMETINDELGMDNIENHNDSRNTKGQRMNLSSHSYIELDEDDRQKRDEERAERRNERWNKRLRSHDHPNPFGLERKENTNPRVVLSDDMDFLSDEREEFEGGNFVIGGSASSQLNRSESNRRASHRAIHGSKNDTRISHKRRRR